MTTLRIEMDRGNGWELRGEGEIPTETTVERIRQELVLYCSQYAHRALLDGAEVARARRARNGRVVFDVAR
jgi:hypothetical protein